MVANLLGGIGLFLLGMTLLTEGLKSLAGDALRRHLARFAGGPTRAMFSGAALTALIQSSSATTLATIGFVSAGLLALPQAIGLIMGANLGTTSTAWLVSLVGLEFSVSLLGLPLVGIGALARLLARDRLASAGTAMAGFGLVFVGIDALQAGMLGLAAHIDPSQLPGDTFGGRALLVVAGIVMTVLMQSSSAAVATTLAGVESGTITLIQAAALVVGQNIGTTLTAAVAVVGASVPARRAAASHISFNAVTGAVSLIMLPVFVWLVSGVSSELGSGRPAITIALFHTAFNVLGIAIFLPFTNRFAGLLERMVPDRAPALTRWLDPSVTRVAAVAIDAARRTLTDIGVLTLSAAAAVVRHEPAKHFDEFEPVTTALGQTRRFLARLRTESTSATVHARHLAVLHAIDHLGAMVHECVEIRQVPHVGFGPEIDRLGEELAGHLDRTRLWLEDLEAGNGTAGGPLVEELEAFAVGLAARRQQERASALEGTATGALAPDVAAGRLELLNRLERLARASWRAANYLEEARSDGAGAS